MVIMTTIMIVMIKTKFSILNENGNKLDLWDRESSDGDGDYGDPNIKILVFSNRKATHLISGIGRAVIPVATPCRMGVTPVEGVVMKMIMSRMRMGGCATWGEGGCMVTLVIKMLMRRRRKRRFFCSHNQSNDDRDTYKMERESFIDL